jgi:hypothetical protein
LQLKANLSIFILLSNSHDYRNVENSTKIVKFEQKLQDNTISLYSDIIYMSAQLKEIQTVFRGLQTLYQSYIPKADPVLVNDLLARLYENPNPNAAPFYMVEIFTKPGTDSEALRQRVWNTTGMMPAIYDNGTHYVINQRLTLEKLKEISDSEDVIEVTGDYTGTLTGLGASHDSRRHENTIPTTTNYHTSQQTAVLEKETKGPGSESFSSIQAKQDQKASREYDKDKKKKSKIIPYKPLIFVTIGVAVALAIGGFILSGGMPPNINQNNNALQTQTSTSSINNPSGALHGYVGGPAGLPAIGASVIAANQETGYTENAIISLNGQYFLGNLSPGEYIVMVAYPDGTNKVVNEYQVGSGSNHELNFSY